MADDGYTASATFDAAFVHSMVHQLPQLLSEALVARLADEIIATKKQEIIAKVPLESILNQAVAETVRRIAETK